MTQKMSALVFALALALAAAPLAAAPANVAGVWQLTVELQMGTGRPVVTLVQDGEKVTGTYEGRYGKSKLEGTVTDNKIAFVVTIVAEGTTVNGAFEGTVDGDRMKGEFEWEGAGGGTWTAVRAAVKK